MKKLIAILLASVMVACCFAVSASAADTNLVAGKTYVLTSNDEVIAYNGICEDGINPGGDSYLGLYSGTAILTDGAVRVGTEDTPIKDAVSGTTVEFAGTTRAYTLTFDLGGEFAVSSVVVKNARIAGNRSFNIIDVQVSADGTNWTAVDFEKAFVVAENAEQVNAAFSSGGQDPRDATFNVTASFAAVNAAHIAVTFDTSNPGSSYYNFFVDNSGSDLRGYIASFDEIEVYGSEAAEDVPVESEDAPVESEDAPVASEDAPVESEDAPIASEDAPVESEDAPVASEDAPVESEDAPVASEVAPVESEDAPVASESTPVVDDNTTPDTGDAGLAVFAVLAVVSMAGVVVAKKVK